VTLRGADQFIRERVDLVIEYQIDQQVAAMISNKYRGARTSRLSRCTTRILVRPISAPTTIRAGLIGGRHLGRWARHNWEGHVDEIVMVELSRAGPVPKTRPSGTVQGIREAVVLRNPIWATAPPDSRSSTPGRRGC
jgi:ribose transport system substrate-binding protein